MNKQKILLVVEDEEDMRQVVVEKLEELGHKVYQAVDGEDGFRIAQEVHPDLVVSDVVMPKSDGNQLLKELRKTDFGKNIPFIVITARTAMRDYFEVINVSAFFEKPFKLKDLAQKIEEVLTEKMPEINMDKKKKQKYCISDELKGSDIIVQEESLFNDSMFDVDEITGKAAIVEEQKRAKGQWDGRSRVHLTEARKVLIYEFELSVYKELENIFKKRECATELVLTRDECIEEAKRVMPNIILIRAKLESRDSEEFAERLRGMPLLSEIPIIVYGDIGAISNDTQDDRGERAFVLNDEGMQLVKMVNKVLK